MKLYTFAGEIHATTDIIRIRQVTHVTAWTERRKVLRRRIIISRQNHRPSVGIAWMTIEAI